MAKDEDLSGVGPAKPGGVYEDARGAGTFHDAHGRPVTEDGRLLDAEMPGAVNPDEEEWRADMEKQRKASAAAGAREMARGKAQSSDLDSMSVDELQAMAEQQGVEVEGSGANGRVLKADLVKALGG